MAPEHFHRVLTALQHRTPFRPFTVELVSGDQFRIDHPEALVSRAGVAVFINKAGTPYWFDHESVSQFIGNRRKRAG